MSRSVPVPASTGAPMDVSIIVVSYNSAGCIEHCLASVERQEGIAAEILVVDNSSTDNTVGLLRDLRASIRLLVNHENVGFGAACNQAFRHSHGRFLFFLNPDAQLEDSHSLMRLCRAMEQHSRWGLAGTRVLSPDGRDEAV